MTNLKSEETELPQSMAGMRIEKLTANFLEDKNRVRVNLVISDVTQRPTIELALMDADQNEITRSIILEVMNPSLQFTLHLTRKDSSSAIFVIASLIKADGATVDERIELVL